jgi:uncharacterized repeat protein (TIGR03803 family)
MHLATAGVVLALAASLVSGITTQSAQAQTPTTLHSFDRTDGADLQAGLVQAGNGDLYGTTEDGGVNNDGSVFKITPGGTLTTLYSLCTQPSCTDGYDPQAGLVLGINGNLYGTTYYGGANDAGTIFQISPRGVLATLYNFCSQSLCSDGAEPQAGLVQAANGDLFGTTYEGGAYGFGTVFKIAPGGTPVVLHSFDNTDGANPYAGLVLATNGDFYGTTYKGGADSYPYGTVFKITPGGTFTLLHSFEETDGYFPIAGLIQAANGLLYGTTFAGGANGDGTVFQITPSGSLTTVHNFAGADGAYPWAGVIQATDGNLYGTTYGGGAYGEGTIFKIALSSGTLTPLYSFCPQSGCTDGAEPAAALVQGTNGDFYGTTENGGANNDGTVFSLSEGLGPFVETLPTSGKVGAAVIILGNNLAGATAVSFDGTAATFTVASSTEIKTTVPTGATTGNVEVTTSSGTLKSNVVFRVTP